MGSPVDELRKRLFRMNSWNRSLRRSPASCSYNANSCRVTSSSWLTRAAARSFRPNSAACSFTVAACSSWRSCVSRNSSNARSASATTPCSMRLPPSSDCSSRILASVEFHSSSYVLMSFSSSFPLLFLGENGGLYVCDFCKPAALDRRIEFLPLRLNGLLGSLAALLAFLMQALRLSQRGGGFLVLLFRGIELGLDLLTLCREFLALLGWVLPVSDLGDFRSEFVDSLVHC